MKPWWKSRVLWFNVAAAVFGVLEATTDLIGPALGITSAQFVAGYSIAVAVVNAALRVITTQALAFKKGHQE